MKQAIEFLPAALHDIAVGQLFYEEQSPGLGAYFRDTLNSDARSLLITAGAHRKVHGLHRYLSKRFPHAIFYRVKGDTVATQAVLDSRRDPEEIRRRLR